jgi:(1->4)-alpha-D-glucan 1-alpha-D-glucosylmutase
MSTALERLATACGIAPGYHDIWGGYHATSDSTRRDLLAAMHFDMTRDPDDLLAAWQAERATTANSPAIETASGCFQPVVLKDDGRVWGLTVQLYSLRSRRNWGMGDFSDLATLVDFVAAAGGDFIGLNPLHALFPDNPAHISPYSPSHRGFLNVLYLDVEALPEFAGCMAARSRLASADFQSRLAALRAADCVDHVGVAQAKFEILPLLFAQFKQVGGSRAHAFADWRAQQGEALERHARYEALQAHFRKTAGTWGWPAWPQEFHDPAAQAVTDFATTHTDTVTYSAWLQWVADAQLAAVAARAKSRGMAIGLYQDLAVGANSGGSEVWSWQSIFAIDNGGASTGAPPDELNLLGQDWGLPPFVPHRLRDVGYAPFIDILRSNMKHVRALRIHHVMWLT